MLLASLLLLVSAIIQPSLKSNELQQLVVISNNLDRWFATQAFALCAIEASAAERVARAVVAEQAVTAGGAAAPA